jgi:hypothetical protein
MGGGDYNSVYFGLIVGFFFFISSFSFIVGV